MDYAEFKQPMRESIVRLKIANWMNINRLPVSMGGHENVANGEPADLKFEQLDDVPAEVDADTPHVVPEAMALDDDRVPTTPNALPNADQDVMTPRTPGEDVDMNVVESDAPLEKMLDMLNSAQSEEVKAADDEIMSLIRSLGGNASRYRRERGKALKAIVSEIYSPPRVSAIALDLTTHDDDGRHWDFDEAEMRARVWEKVR